MTNKEKDILALFNELNSMLYEVLGDYNKLLAENIELKKTINRYRNDPNVMFEPTDEEVTKTFMDAQTNAKDIEFDAEKLVKSVKDYADSLNNESNLKYFCASNGKWYNAELMKQDTEPELMPLKQHNDSKLNNAYGGNVFKTGIACPKCGSELHYTNPGVMLASYPPRKPVNCKNCKHNDYVY